MLGGEGTHKYFSYLLTRQQNPIGVDECQRVLSSGAVVVLGFQYIRVILTKALEKYHVLAKHDINDDDR